jgi:arylformamidase
MFYDITPPVDRSTRVWPGDTPLSREVLLDTQRGDLITLSTLRATVHLGAHADAPSHVLADGRSIDECPIDDYVGVCQVIGLEVGPKARVVAGDLPVSICARRVLFRTGTFTATGPLPEDFAALTPELADFLHALGVCLVGVDTPSVDLFDSKDLPAHRAFFGHGIAVLEGLDLQGVPEGLHELIALPLKLAGFEASPVRAVLRPFEPRKPAEVP